jgi:hypothetical protein
MKKYRLRGDEFRNRIRDEPNPIYKAHLTVAYNWLKQNWFNGLEFKNGSPKNASLAEEGLQCLPGDIP